MALPISKLIRCYTLLIAFFFCGLCESAPFDMGSIIGVIGEETPSFEVLATRPTYSVKEYGTSLIATVEYENDNLEKGTRGPFQKLARYIGVFGNPQNKGIMNKTDPEPMPLAMTAPVLMGMDGEGNKKKTMSFVLPSKLGQMVEDAPVPNDSGIKIEALPDRIQAVRVFSWSLSEKNVMENRNQLLKDLESDEEYTPEMDEDGLPKWTFAGYNPPWTLAFMKTNEIMVDVVRKVK